MAPQNGVMTQHVSGPPYAPTTASVGESPVVNVDIPIEAVFLALYIGGAIGNMTLFQINRRRGHKFILSWVMFGFCMSRITTCVLRIAWATRLHNIRLALAAQIFTNLGILVVYIVLWILAQRIMRADHPTMGWHPSITWISRFLYLGLLCAIGLLVGFTIDSFYTLDRKLKLAALWVNRGSVTFLLIMSLASTVLLILSVLIPRSRDRENFGVAGGMTSKQIVLAVACFFSNFDAGFRAGTSWSAPRAINNPAWYDSKPAFYVIEFGFEIIIIYWLIVTRFDRRFWVPNGSCKPGDYSRGTLRSASRSPSVASLPDSIASMEITRTGRRKSEDSVKSAAPRLGRRDSEMSMKSDYLGPAPADRRLSVDSDKSKDSIDLERK